MSSSGIDIILSPRRRGWILMTAITATVMFSWASISHLNDLIEVQQLPTDMPNHSLLERAEHNIASHLHLGGNTGSTVGGSSGGSNSAFRSSGNGVGGASHAIATEQQGGKGGGAVKADPNVIGQQAPAAKRDVGVSSPKPRSPPKLPPPESKKAAAKAAGGTCEGVTILKHTDFWGEAIVWGNENLVKSEEECCATCAAYKPKRKADAPSCNVWVYCDESIIQCAGHQGECWLKHLAHPHGTAPAKEGPQVGWTTGIMSPPPLTTDEVDTSETPEERKYHIVISAQGSATHWQSRVHYYWFKKIKARCEAEGGCQMGGFTRILHSGEPDDLMEEIPTFVAQTLPPEHPDHGYIVLNRPWAFMQWVQQVEIPEKYVLMSEPDHIWLRPMPNLMVGKHPAAFPFFYIEPSKKENVPIVSKFLGPLTRVEAEDIAPIGSAPTMLSWEDMKRVAPLWFNLSIAVHNDPVASKEWGWVQEMYAFTLALYKSGERNVGLHLKMMSQPPFDTKMDPYYILHYTYGMDYTLEGVFTPGKYGEWRFDKRSYSMKPPPRNLGEPPEGMQNELVRHLIHAINEATSVIPGWDEFAETGIATEVWDGVLPDDTTVTRHREGEE